MGEEQHKCFKTFHFVQHPVDLFNRHLWESFFYYCEFLVLGTFCLHSTQIHSPPLFRPSLCTERLDNSLLVGFQVALVNGRNPQETGSGWREAGTLLSYFPSFQC